MSKCIMGVCIIPSCYKFSALSQNRVIKSEESTVKIGSRREHARKRKKDNNPPKPKQPWHICAVCLAIAIFSLKVPHAVGLGQGIPPLPGSIWGAQICLQTLMHPHVYPLADEREPVRERKCVSHPLNSGGLKQCHIIPASIKLSKVSGVLPGQT